MMFRAGTARSKSQCRVQIDRNRRDPAPLARMLAARTPMGRASTAQASFGTRAPLTADVSAHFAILD